MRRKPAIGVIIGVVIGVSLSTVAVVLAGNPAGPGTPPGATNSYTLADIYHSLNRGTAATSSTFTEPSAGPGTGTMYTLDEIYTLTRQRAHVPKTGQTVGYYSGDDGYLAKGVTWPSPRFTDNSDGTVIDNLTGLIWLKNANCAASTMYWTTAMTEVASLNSAGTMNGHDCGDTSNSGSHQTDWRLPNVREMQSLVHYGFSNPAVPNTAGTGKWTAGDPFTGVQSYYYWTSTAYADNTSWAWVVYLVDGIVRYGGYPSSLNVWPVRGGQ